MATDVCGQDRRIRCGAECMTPAPTGWLGEFEAWDPEYGPSHESRTLQVIDVGAHYLIAWQDGRSDGSGWSVSDAVLVSRVTHDGRVLDPGGVMIAEPGENKILVDLIDAGEQVLLLLLELHGDETESLLVLPLDATGHPATGAQRVTTENLYGVRAAFDGAELVVAWANDTDASVYIQSVHPTNLALGPRHTLSTVGFPHDLSLAVNDGAVLFAWVQGTNADDHVLRTARLDADAEYAPRPLEGTAIADPLGPLASRYFAQDNLVWPAPGGFAVTHEHADIQAGNRTLHVTFLDAQGRAQGSPIEAHSQGAYQEFRAAATVLGDRLALTFLVGRERHGVLIDPALGSVGSLSERLAGSSTSADLLCGAGPSRECVLAAHDGSLHPQTSLQRLSADLEPLGRAHSVATQADHQVGPRVAFDGSQYLITWVTVPSNEHPNVADNPVLHARRLDPAGRWLDATPFTVPMSDAFGYQHSVVPYAGGGFLVRWREERDFRERLYVRRLGADGQWVWPAAIPLDVYGAYDYSFGPSICAVERCLLTVAETFGPTEYLIIDGSGAPITEVLGVPDLPDDSTHPALALEAGTVWMAFLYDDEIRVRGIAMEGASVGVPVASEFDLPTPPDERRRPPVWLRFDGSLHLLSGLTVRDPAGPEGFRHLEEARRFDPARGLGPTVTVVDNLDPSHRWVGAVEAGGELHIFFVGHSATREQLFRARYTAANGPLEGPLAFLEESWFGSIGVTSGSAGGLMAYDRFDWSVGFGGERLRLRFVGDRAHLLSDNASCVDDGQCGSGRCRQDRCCDECPLWKGL